MFFKFEKNNEFKSIQVSFWNAVKIIKNSTELIYFNYCFCDETWASLHQS